MKVIFLTLVLFLVGCASVPKASVSDDILSKQFIPSQGVSNLYLLRKNRFCGSAAVMQIGFDGKIVGALSPDTYVFIESPSGEHSIQAFLGLAGVGSQKVIVDENENYFFSVDVNMGWNTVSLEISPLSEEDGQKKVLGLKRAKNLY